MVTQRDKILELLREKGTVSNYDLNSIAFRYGARLQELRDNGYVITSRHIKGSKWTFTLTETPHQMELV